MMLKDILGAKGDKVFTIAPEATLNDVIHQLVEHNVGSLVVCSEGDQGQQLLLGIITERDILHCFAAGKFNLVEISVSEAMTSKLITGSPEDLVDKVMGLMTEKRIRHLPVVVETRLVGIVSIGDVVKAQHDRLAIENRFMKDYIQS